MTAGQTWPSESVVEHDATTGASMRRVTSAPAMHHHPFFYVPAYDDQMARLVFVSHRSGSPQLFCEDRDSRQLVQLTQHAGLNEWSLHPSHDGKWVYFTVGSSLRRVSCETLVEETLCELQGTAKQQRGTVGGAMGTTTLSRDDRWWGVTFHLGPVVQLIVVDTGSGACEVVAESEQLFHPEFCPEDSSLLRYASAHDRRMWVVSRIDKQPRLVYERDAERKEWVTHESWLPGRELVAVDWPHGVFRVDLDSGARSPVTSFPAWHPIADRSGSVLVTDTNWPDRGLYLVDLAGESPPKPLCASGASNVGEHWFADHCVYDDGPVEVYAPQHTHPHPGFSPDGRYVVFTSDRSGVAQLYEVELSPEVVGDVIWRRLERLRSVSSTGMESEDGSTKEAGA